MRCNDTTIDALIIVNDLSASIIVPFVNDNNFDVCKSLIDYAFEAFCKILVNPVNWNYN